MSDTNRKPLPKIKDEEMLFRLKHGLESVPKAKFVKGKPKHGIWNDETKGQDGKRFAKKMEHRKNRRLDRDYIDKCMNYENED